MPLTVRQTNTNVVPSKPSFHLCHIHAICEFSVFPASVRSASQAPVERHRAAAHSRHSCAEYRSARAQANVRTAIGARAPITTKVTKNSEHKIKLIVQSGTSLQRPDPSRRLPGIFRAVVFSSRTGFLV